MGLKNMDMGPTLRMLRTLSQSPNDAAEPDQAAAAAPAVWAARPEVAAVAAESAPAFMQSPIAKQYREVRPQSTILQVTLHQLMDALAETSCPAARRTA